MTKVGIMRVHGLEDNDAVVELFKHQMEINGIPYEIYDNQEDFLASLVRSPSICFVDYKLNGPMNGVDITGVITADNMLPDTKVIMISGITGDMAFDEARRFFNKCKGWRWVKKTDDHNEWIKEFMNVLQETIAHIHNYKERHYRLSSNDGLVVRRDREPLSKEPTERQPGEMENDN